MGVIPEYIISITAAALISSVLSALLEKKGMPGTMGKLFCGVFLSISLIRPLTDISFASVSDWIESSGTVGYQIAAQGEEISSAQIQASIKKECEAYIQDKASIIGLEITAQVELETAAPYAPASVTIRGNAPPYDRFSLTRIIEEDLALPKEKIRWI